MPALLFNIRINSIEKLTLFKANFADIIECFNEVHAKIRGEYAPECIDFMKDTSNTEIAFYQHLANDNWMKATLRMVQNVKSRSVFCFYEDHKLVGSVKKFKKVLLDFDKLNLDYLAYSGFQASMLDTKNLLPLRPKQEKDLDIIEVNEESVNLIGKISERYCTYVSMSISSVEYLKNLLKEEDKRILIYSKYLTHLLVLIFPHPKYRKVFYLINKVVGRLNARLCIEPPTAPMNLEKIWFEFCSFGKSWKYGILKEELFANFDDDNGAYGESLIKKGIYPFDPKNGFVEYSSPLIFEVNLKKNQQYDCTYYSRKARLTSIPWVRVETVKGDLVVHYKENKEVIVCGNSQNFFLNIGPVLVAKAEVTVRLYIYDNIVS